MKRQLLLEAVEGVPNKVAEAIVSRQHSEWGRMGGKSMSPRLQAARRRNAAKATAVRVARRAGEKV